MKTHILMVIYGLVAITTMNAQSDKQKKTTKTSSDCQTYSSSSISISSDNDSYSMSARFNNEKTENVLDILNEQLGNKNRTAKRGTWESIKNNQTAYKIKLTKGRLKIFVNKDLVTANTISLFENLGDKISEAVSSRPPGIPDPPRNW